MGKHGEWVGLETAKTATCGRATRNGLAWDVWLRAAEWQLFGYNVLTTTARLPRWTVLFLHRLAVAGRPLARGRALGGLWNGIHTHEDTTTRRHEIASNCRTGVRAAELALFATAFPLLWHSKRQSLLPLDKVYDTELVASMPAPLPPRYYLGIGMSADLRAVSWLLVSATGDIELGRCSIAPTARRCGMWLTQREKKGRQWYTPNTDVQYSTSHYSQA